WHDRRQRVTRMQTTGSVTAERARDLLRKNADLATWMAELGARGSAAAIALTGAGTPPPDDLIQELAEAGREFIALRGEVFALRAKLKSATDVDADAIAPFAELLSLFDGQQDLDDEQWGALEDAVAAAFGCPLAVAATRGKLGAS